MSQEWTVALVYITTALYVCVAVAAGWNLFRAHKRAISESTTCATPTQKLHRSRLDLSAVFLILISSVERAFYLGFFPTGKSQSLVQLGDLGGFSLYFLAKVFLLFRLTELRLTLRASSQHGNENDRHVGHDSQSRTGANVVLGSNQTIALNGIHILMFSAAIVIVPTVIIIIIWMARREDTGRDLVAMRWVMIIWSASGALLCSYIATWFDWRTLFQSRARKLWPGRRFSDLQRVTFVTVILSVTFFLRLGVNLTNLLSPWFVLHCWEKHGNVCAVSLLMTTEVVPSMVVLGCLNHLLCQPRSQTVSDMDVSLTGDVMTYATRPQVTP